MRKETMSFTMAFFWKKGKNPHERTHSGTPDIDKRGERGGKGKTCWPDTVS